MTEKKFNVSAARLPPADAPCRRGRAPTTNCGAAAFTPIGERTGAQMPLRSFQQLEPNAATPPKPERCFSGACLDATSIIAVSAVGAGFLVIPTITSPLGVWPTAVGLTLAWLFLALALISALICPPISSA